MPDAPFSTDKARLRAEVLGRRDALDPELRKAGARGVAETVIGIPALAEAGLVGGFWPIRSEIDPRPLLEKLFARGQRVALPKVTPDGLVFREWRAGEALVRGGFGLSEPRDDLPEVFPTALIVPLAAFDRTGNRIGYGKGYYDRAIERLSGRGMVLTIGIAFAVQEVPHVPAEAHDRPLDHLVTETGPVPLTRS
ncbi:5-formyltetrahydrofolate cyclo-ligase [Methylobacterium haplocladii]|uniref:5-formyltetrahydrofolate cyclo-ligase n=1 Tax=Methylobacterium haplocladii TaxID=1176176 RepID=A0A512IQZ3_9HYPH|nr:5-formyltetrahydrofolate cyclo-ligase [Methylobacterium haplocladii]GEP00135.1 5-formyltetrahydrofolate cyclo-ligase [Methylobacterium haplocladii]GJD85385.1 5-formyltetrahydrofolate cyclo-ligase [Methylobacterium haplocladii]GLS58183.1 5-formyltetrahydrofolate cyclo-ligase [Methylobacterium haplocladii]